MYSSYILGIDTDFGFSWYALGFKMWNEKLETELKSYEEVWIHIGWLISHILWVRMW